MGNSKIVFGDRTLIDLSGDTVTPQDLRVGVTAHNAAGEQIAGTLDPGGTPSEPPMEADINFYDYDGTLLYAWTLDELAGKTALPGLPTRTGLICQGWNWTLAEIKSLNRKVQVGLNYITDDGKTRLYITIPDVVSTGTIPLCFLQTVANGVIVDWGDGSAPQTFAGTGEIQTTHQFTPGDHIITLAVADGCTLTLGRNATVRNVLGPFGPAKRAVISVLKRVEIGKNVSSLGSHGFTQCGQLRTITVPTSVTSVGANTFEACGSLKAFVVPKGCTISEVSSFYANYSLQMISIPSGVKKIGRYLLRNSNSLPHITFPNSVTEILGYVMTNCQSIDEIIIPDTVTSLSGYTFDTCLTAQKLVIGSGITTIPNNFASTCYSLIRIDFPAGITSIGASAFANCQGVLWYNFTHCAAVPTLANTNAFTNINANCKIEVPAALVDEWKAATNWATYADHIVGIAQGGGSAN
jgi:hypothetical protein